MLAELRGRAHYALSGDRAAHTLQPTASVYEVFLRMERGKQERWESRDHFVRSAAKVMRQILIDHHRRKTSQKRDGQKTDLDMNLLAQAYNENSIDYLALDAALDKLGVEQPDMAEAVQLHFFAGVKNPDIARILNIPLRTLERRMLTVRAWLRIQLQ